MMIPGHLKAMVAVRQIGWMEAAAMQRFGYTYDQARAYVQAKRRRAGRLKSSKGRGRAH